MTKTILSIVFVAFFATSTIAQKLPPNELLDQMILAGMEDWQVPGLAALVVKDGEVVFKKTYGIKSILTNEPVNENTLFGMASTTKAIIAISIGMLVDQGKLNWEDKVIQYLPSFKLSDPYVTADARVIDLLTHNLGIGNADFLWIFDSLSTSQTVKRFQHAERVYPLRGGFVYQNIMYAIAGQLIESVSGQHWTTFVEDNIFSPLNMNRSQTKSINILTAGNYTTPHVNAVDDGVIKIDYNFSDQIGAAGGIWSSINDISNYLSFLISDGVFEGDTLLQPATFEYLFKPHSILSNPYYPIAVLTNHNWNTYGLGWFQQDYRGKKLDFHTGSGPGLVAIAGVMHDHNTAVYVFANLNQAELRHAIMYKALDLFVFNDDTRDWNKEVFDLYSSFKEKESKNLFERDSCRVLGTRPTLPIEKFAGIYENKMLGTISVEVVEEQLLININNYKSYKCIHWHYNTFLTKYPKDGWELMINFTLNQSGRVNSLEFWGEKFMKIE